MNKTHTINIAEGQTLLLYKGDKILLRKKHDCGSTITTSWESFVGSDADVDAKIASLSLSEIKKPKELKKPVVEEVAKPERKANFGEKLLGFLKTIFSK